MNDSVTKFPIVGSKYRMPAPTIIAHLTMHQPLLAIREPGNQYDSNAVAIWIESLTDDMKSACIDQPKSDGSSLTEEELSGRFHLGYIPKSMNSGIAEHMDTNGYTELPARLVFTSEGSPAVEIAPTPDSGTLEAPPNETTMEFPDDGSEEVENLDIPESAYAQEPETFGADEIPDDGTEELTEEQQAELDRQLAEEQ